MLNLRLRPDANVAARSDAGDMRARRPRMLSLTRWGSRSSASVARPESSETRRSSWGPRKNSTSRNGLPWTRSAFWRSSSSASTPSTSSAPCATECPQPDQFRSGLDQPGLRQLHLMLTLAWPKCHHPRHRKRRETRRKLPHCYRETGPTPVQIVETDKHGILERSLLDEGLHVLEEPEQKLRRSVDVIKRAPIRERRIPLKQRVEESTQLDYPPRLGRPSPDPERELPSHRYALVEQPRLAEPGAALHHDHAAGARPDLAQPPAYDRKLLLTSAEGRTERSVHLQRILAARSAPRNAMVRRWRGWR